MCDNKHVYARDGNDAPHIFLAYSMLAHNLRPFSAGYGGGPAASALASPHRRPDKSGNAIMLYNS